MTAPVQYGTRITAIVVYLYVGQFLSRQRTAAALAELFGTPVSPGTVAALTSRAAGGLGGFIEWVRANLAAAEVVNFDETDRWWCWATQAGDALRELNERVIQGDG